ncbi:MAG: HAMP domain-containing sensor histidine kinase [Phycisphaerales bacterium]|jgi:signal transduction histidine kinase|nr:HAMP domain-containing sensor histidine kinase [Phycisphaerales bacterium]
MAREISLANKCLILFGCAIVAILVGALLVPWIGVRTLIHDNQVEIAGQVSDAWLAGKLELGNLQPRHRTELEIAGPDGGMHVSWVPIDDIDTKSDPEAFTSRALQAFTGAPDMPSYTSTRMQDEHELIFYAKPVTESTLRRLSDPRVSDFSSGVTAPTVTDPIRGLLVVSRSTRFGEAQLDRSRAVIVLTGLAAGVLAVIVFWFILFRLIFSPVRRLRRVVDRVGEGQIDARSDVRTGDEFEELSKGLNEMLDSLDEARSRLEQMNENLDLKVSELAEANIGLWESSRFKSEFLANVSHELRTPLNSIIGFADLLREELASEQEPSEKHLRYLANIVSSGSSLLEMINELLNMAKIEAGRMEVAVEPTSIADLVEGISGIMSPQAGAKDIDIQSMVDSGLPAVETDPGKVQQILYNLLSNAIKFTPRSGTVTVTASKVVSEGRTESVALTVSDTGPGIPEDMQDVIFEKFRQIDASHTRAHSGTGLGLAICRELAEMLQSDLRLKPTRSGEGAAFTLVIPTSWHIPKPRALMDSPA